MQIVVLVVAIVLIAFIAWWFFGKHNAQTAKAAQKGNQQEVTITVDGGYSPATVVLQKDVPANLVFKRLDKSNCLDEVVFPDFGVDEKLPVMQAKTIQIMPHQAGEFTYACGMNMFHGKVVVK